MAQTTEQIIDWAKAEYKKGNRTLSVTLALARKDPREMTEEDMERQRTHDDAVYHQMKEDHANGRLTD